MHKLSTDTPILTTDGWTTVGEITTEQTIFTYDGKPERVFSITNPEAQTIVELETESGYKVRGARDSALFYLDTQQRLLASKLKQTRELIRDYVLSEDTIIHAEDLELFLGEWLTHSLGLKNMSMEVAAVIELMSKAVTELESPSDDEKQACYINTLGSIQERVFQSSDGVRMIVMKSAIRPESKNKGKRTDLKNLFKGKPYSINELSPYSEKLSFLKAALLQEGESSSKGTGRYYISIPEANRESFISLLRSMGHTPFTLEPSKQVMFQSNFNYYEGTPMEDDWKRAHDTFNEVGSIKVTRAEELGEGQVREITLLSGKPYIAGTDYLLVPTSPKPAL